MTVRTIQVFYEDQRSGSRGFSLHDLVIVSVLDRLDGDMQRHEVTRRVHGLPLKGNSRVLEKCRRDLPRLADGQNVVVAPPGTCTRDIITELKRGCRPPEALHIVLLGDNLETLLKALRTTSGLTLATPADFDRALDGKDPDARDVIFKRAAGDPAARRYLAEQVPSFARLVRRIGELLSS